MQRVVVVVLILVVCVFCSHIKSPHSPRSEWVGGYLSSVYSHLVTEPSYSNELFLLDINRFNSQTDNHGYSLSTNQSELKPTTK